MQTRRLALVVALAVAGWLVPGVVQADLKLAIISVKGMVCRA